MKRIIAVICLFLCFTGCTSDAQDESRASTINETAATVIPAETTVTEELTIPKATEEETIPTTIVAEVETVATEPEIVEETEYQTTYVLNTNSKKFHYSHCSSAGDIKESNKSSFTGSRDEIIAKGYSPCGRCDP